MPQDNPAHVEIARFSAFDKLAESSDGPVLGSHGNRCDVEIDCHYPGHTLSEQSLLPSDSIPSSIEIAPRGTILVYRDRIVPKSEAQFLRRLYIGFEQLDPVWVGCRLDAGVQGLGADPVILGAHGPMGAVERVLFKHLGILPRRPSLAALHPRLIHAHFGLGGALALPIARALKIPLVVTFHGGDATKEKHYDSRLIPTIFQRRLAALKEEAALFICVSDYIRDRLIARGFPKDKLRVVRYGVEPDDPDAPAAAPGYPYVLFVGRFVEKKGIAHLIEAMRILEARNLDIRLVLVGDGPMAIELKGQAEALSNPQFLGWMPNHQVRAWMRGALAVSVPSVAAQSGDSEGLPNVLLEAMAVGAPVVGSIHAGIPEAIEHGRTGLLVSPGDPGALADALQSLVQDPLTRQRMRKVTLERVAERFDAKAQSRLLEATLLSVAS